MKILIVSEYYPPHVLGGAEISTQLLAESLAKWCDVHVLTPNYSSYSSSVKKENEVTVHRFKSKRYFVFKRRGASKKVYKTSRSFFDFVLNKYVDYSVRELDDKISALDEQENFDVVHGTNYESVLALATAAIGGRKVAHLRDFRLMKATGTIRKLDAFVAISSFIRRKYVKSGLSPKTTKRVYNPISPEIVSPLTKLGARRKLGIKGDTILFVGSLTRDKGAHLIPEFAEHLDYNFVVVGDGPEMGVLKRHENVDARGFVPHNKVRDYYRAADILIVPSQWDEPFGRVVVEGQANGCVVVATRKGALPEIITNGRTGYVTNDFVSRIKKISEKGKELARKNCESVMRNYDPDSVASEVLEVYRSAIK